MYASVVVWYMSTGVKERKKTGTGHSSTVQDTLSSNTASGMPRDSFCFSSLFSVFLFFGCIKVDERLKKA